MKIKYLTIKNFRCHKYLTDIPFHDLTTFIGENDCGKTTIIDFLDIMIGNNKPSERDFFRSNLIQESGVWQESEIIGEILFELDDKEKDYFHEYSYGDKYFKIKRVFNIDGSENTYYYGKKFKDERFYMYKSMKAAELKSLLNDFNLEDQSNQELRKKRIEEFINENKNNDSIFEDGWVSIKYSEIKNFMPKFIRYDIDDYRDPNNIVLKTLQEVFESEIYEFDEFGKKGYRVKELESIMGNVSKNLSDASNKLIDYVKEYNDSITSVEIEPDIDLSSGLKHALIRVTDNIGMEQSLEDKGFGTKKRMFMAIMEWTRDVTDTGDRNIIRCYDEPDNNLHIEAQRKLFKTIKSITEDEKTQVVVCTHSLFMIDSSPTDCINFIRREEDGTTSVEYINSDGDEETEKFIHNMCREMGLSNSHIFFEKCFILVEGPTEANFLPIAYQKLFNSSMSEDGISLINLGGNGSAINFLKLLMKNKRDLTIVFLDRDSKKFNKENLMKENNRIITNYDNKEYEKFLEEFFRENVIFVGNEEFEDTFSSKYLAKVLNIDWPKVNGETWDEIEIEKIKIENEKFTDKLLPEVSRQSADWLSKPELGISLAEYLTHEDTPEEIEQLFNRARQIIGI